MPHGAAFHLSLYCLYRLKKIFIKKNTLFFQKNSPTSLDIYNGLSKKYFIKKERKNPLAYKGLKPFDGTKTIQNIDLQELSYTGSSGVSIKSSIELIREGADGTNVHVLVGHIKRG